MITLFQPYISWHFFYFRSIDGNTVFSFSISFTLECHLFWVDWVDLPDIFSLYCRPQDYCEPRRSLSITEEQRLDYQPEEKQQLPTYTGSIMAEVTIEAKKCIGVDCPNDAGTLQCPTCLKLGRESSFCSQDCFKRSWVGYLVPS